ncbi:MAG: hypothetical protein HY720_12875 [Planctomycetes bacterium]|nr:hypothetical protein [Planctomycetota bacterium]
MTSITRHDSPDGSVFHEVLSEHRVVCYVHWKPLARRWIEQNLPGWGITAIVQLMWQWVDRGGEVDRVEETKEEYRDKWTHHYDLRIPVKDRRVYVETRLDIEDKVAYVVNVHDP